MPDAPSNRLLRLLPAIFPILRPRLQLVALKPRRILHHAYVPVRQIYFVEHGLISVALVDGQGSHGTESWLIGSEGLTGLSALLDPSSSPHQCTVQVEASAWVIGAADMERAMNDLPEFRNLLLRYVHSMLVQNERIATCPLFRHTVPQRLARCLLLAHDRLKTPTMALVRDAIPGLLAVTRVVADKALDRLEDTGAIACERLRIAVRDRPRLERLACSCYGILKAESGKNLGAEA